jgi:uncharacterized protein (DUF2236 family)
MLYVASAGTDTLRCAMTPGSPLRPTLEDRLAQLRAEVDDPRGGIFGPGSLVWEVNREAIVFLGAGRAALLQLAHPDVAWAIEQHSRTQEDPLGRFRRTFLHVFRMVYGDLDEALGSARAVHALHGRIRGVYGKGRRYSADEPTVLLWVHATLWHTSVLCYEALVRPLSLAEKDRYLRETGRFAALFAIPDEVLPPDWARFDAYVREMLEGDALAVSAPAASMARLLFEPPVPGTRALVRRYGEITAWWLPERLARGFGLERGGEAGRRRAESALRALGGIRARLPRRLRHLPAYVEAQRRIDGRRGRDPLGALLGRLWVGGAGGC